MQLQKYTDHGRGLEIVVIVVGHHRVLVIPEDSGVLDWLSGEVVRDMGYVVDFTIAANVEDVFYFILPSSDAVPEFLRVLEHQLRVLDYELDNDTAPSSIDPITNTAVGTVS